MNRPDRTWRDPDALCRVGKAHDVVKVAVPQHEHAIEAIENLLIVGDGDDRRVLIYGQLAQEVHHDLRPLRVKCGSRLVGQNDAGAIGERPGDGNALRLASRKLCGKCVFAAPDFEIVEEVDSSVAVERL